MVETISLSIPAVDVLAEQLDLSVRQYPLDIPRGTEHERARARPQVWTELESSGLARSGKPAPEVEDALYLLCSSEVAIAAAGLLDAASGQRLAARVVATGEVGLIGLLDQRGLRMTFCAPDELPRACADLLPAHAAGSGQDVRAVADRSQGVPADADIAGFDDLRRMFAGPKKSLGHYALTQTDRWGNIGQVGNLMWFDAPHGRYVMSGRRMAETDEVWAGPADAERIAEHLRELLESSWQSRVPLQ